MKDAKKKALGLMVALGNTGEGDEAEPEMDRKAMAVKKLAKAFGIDPSMVKVDAAVDAISTLVTECGGEEDNDTSSEDDEDY